jgi:hypothetical protein
VLRDDKNILRLYNLRFVTLDLLMSYNSVIIIKEITTVQELSNLLGCYVLSTGKYRRPQRSVMPANSGSGSPRRDF